MDDSRHISEDEISKIQYVMEHCQSKIYIRAVLLEDCKLSDKIRSFLAEFSEATDSAFIEIFDKGENPQLESEITAELEPVIALFDSDGKYTGVSFHGVPSGHELESFMYAIYNAAGPGQEISDELFERIKKLKPMNLKIGISPTCVLCPQLVLACQRTAIINSGITAEMVDLVQFPALRKKYKIMSIPALIINNNDVVFGEKNIDELMDILEKH